MLTGLIVKTTGEVEETEFPSDDDNNLDKLKEAVGGWLELVPSLVSDYKRLTIFCNEEGKILGLPLNEKATDITGRWSFDPIAGDIVILGPPDENGYTTSLPEKEMKSLLKTYRP